MKLSIRLIPAAALVLSGCLGKEDPTPPPAELVAHTEVRDLAEALCEYRHKMERVKEILEGRMSAEYSYPVTFIDKDGDQFKVAPVLQDSDVFREAVTGVISQINELSPSALNKTVYESHLNILSVLGDVEAHFAQELVAEYPDQYSVVTDRDIDSRIRVKYPGVGDNVCSKVGNSPTMFFGSYVHEEIPSDENEQ